MVHSVDTIYLRDSIFVSERQKGDTVYLTRTEWCERWRTKIMRDTIRDTKYITQTMESPQVKYVPRFYKWCTAVFWVIVLLFMGYKVVKWCLFKR